MKHIAFERAHEPELFAIQVVGWILTVAFFAGVLYLLYSVLFEDD